ncbi:MAG: type II secretion system F family protein [Firmicutes bacterium]|nr:type II secretion system F family protein [Bacillota bacterium]
MKYLLLCTRQLASMLRSGLPLVTALEHLSAYFPHRGYAKATGTLATTLRNGHPVHQTMAGMPKLFPDFYCRLLKIGEDNDSLLPALELLGQHYQQRWQIQNQLARMLFYPMLVLTVAGISGLVALWHVTPVFADLYAGLDVIPPPATQAVFALSQALTPFRFALIALLIVAALTGTTMWIRRLPWQARAKIPIMRSINCYYFCRITAMTVAVGKNLEHGLEMAATLNPSGPAPSVLKDLRMGIDLTTSLAESPGLLPAFVAQGEITGDMESTLKRAADYYLEETETGFAMLQRYLEPLSVLAVGGLVALLLLTLMLPLLGIMTAI